MNAGGELADKAAAEIKIELLPVIDGVKLNPDEAYRLSVSGKLIKIAAEMCIRDRFAGDEYIRCSG